MWVPCSTTPYKLIHYLTSLSIPKCPFQKEVIRYTVHISQPAQVLSSSLTCTQKQIFCLRSFLSCHIIIACIGAAQDSNNLLYKIPAKKHALPLNKVVFNTSLMDISKKLLILYRLLYTEISPQFNREKKAPLPDSYHVHLCTWSSGWSKILTMLKKLSSKQWKILTQRLESPDWSFLEEHGIPLLLPSGQRCSFPNSSGSPWPLIL